MNSRAWSGRVGVALALVCAASASRPAAAQQPQQSTQPQQQQPGAGQPAPASPRPGEIESDAVKCWWKTDKTAVHVAERFTLLLTCGVVETNGVKAVVDPNRLDPMTMELAPFEVVSGVRHKDIEAPPWRYFQYSYTVRLVGSEFVGRETTVPSIQLTYRIDSAAGGGTQGRDQLYVMPVLPMRILSLAPASANDILDSSPESFADIEARLFRATGEVTAAGMLFAFAVVLAGLAVVRMSRGGAHVDTADRLLSGGVMLRGCVLEMDRLKDVVARDGWTPQLIGRALAMCRIASAIALGRPLAQAVVEMDAPEREGQLALPKGGRKRVLISAPTTPQIVADGLANGRTADARTQAALEELQSALSVFGVARYGRSAQADSAALDAALEHAVGAARRVRVKTRDAADALANGVASLKGIAWSR